MRRLLLVAAGAASAVLALRQVREVAGTRGPAAALRALEPVAGVTTVVHRALAELRAGTAEREAELRADLLAGADLPRSRARIDAWRAERARTRSESQRADAVHRSGDQATGPRDATDRPDGGREGFLADEPAPRPGSAAAATPRPAGGRTGSHRAEDPDDGSLGYSFF